MAEQKDEFLYFVWEGYLSTLDPTFEEIDSMGSFHLLRIKKNSGMSENRRFQDLQIKSTGKCLGPFSDLERARTEFSRGK